MYREVRKPKDLRTFFIFAKLEGYLVTLRFIKTSGNIGDYRCNTEVRKPIIKTVRNFRFIKSKDIDNDLLGAIGDLVRMDSLRAFTILDGSMCLAAGMKVSAFKILIIHAVILLSCNILVS